MSEQLDNLSAAEVAISKARAASAALDDALSLMVKIVGIGHDAVVALADARRAAQVAAAKLEILIRRIPT